MGVHQRVDRVARRALAGEIPHLSYFPAIREILHFEGLNGPDGIKRKSPGQDEPWHYINPTDANDRQLIDMIDDHIYNLTEALLADNHERAAFEAAWLAHAITDGLTPAHHYPLEEKLEELRGEGLETRVTPKDKLVLPGKTRRHQLRNNWEFWGAKGVMTTHLAFEWGIATSLTGVRMEGVKPHDKDFERLRQDGFEKLFRDAMQHVASLGLYEEFTRIGWTRRLARDTRQILIPIIVETICLAWYHAWQSAEEQKRQA
jgi:hypothetical protein